MYFSSRYKFIELQISLVLLTLSLPSVLLTLLFPKSHQRGRITTD
jgi:hypothetical protein